LAQQTGKQHQEIIHEALANYHREHLLDQVNAAFGKLKADPLAWQQELEERQSWDHTLGDGLTRE
jgi:hypothetical protein